ncbi:MAG: tetratricopeptide repeat protein [Acidobacteriaceae bacterium]|nr:tetratricopeptide repeat protein [Acidobacteriaceae bacterium]
MLGISILCAIALLGADNSSDGIQAFREGRYSVALKELKNAGDPTSKAFLALTEAAVGDCQTALPGLLSVPKSDLQIYRLARIAAVKCSNEPFALVKELLNEFPNDADALYLSAKLHMKAFNDATFAMFQRAPSSYRVHELSGEIFEIENRYGDAAAEYRKAIEANPNAPDLHFRLGRAILLESHNEDALAKAAAEFQSELKLSPEDGACHFQLGQIAQVQGKTDEARPEFERALQLSPNFVQALIALGKVETQAQHYPRAIELLTRAVGLQPTNETAHYALLTAYRDSGQMEKASAEKATLDRLQKPPEGEFSDFLKKLGEKPPQQ